MLSALLPGVRELRIPLVAGALWAACLWFSVGPAIASGIRTAEFARHFKLDVFPTTMWIGVAALLVYLVGSLLVVRTSPLILISRHLRPWLSMKLERLREEKEPARKRFRLIWSVWQKGINGKLSKLIGRLEDAVTTDATPESVDSWLYNEFDSMAADGRIPVMRSFGGGCQAPSGFKGFYDAKSIGHLTWIEDPEQARSDLAEAFVRAVKEERAAVEVRIQMRFPEVYAEIDRLQVEAQLRMSIFWPMIILSCLLAWSWTPVALLGALVPPFFLRDGFKRERQATDKTWGVLVAGEVKSPVLDAMAAAANEDECEDFSQLFPPAPNGSGSTEPEPADQSNEDGQVLPLKASS